MVSGLRVCSCVTVAPVGCCSPGLARSVPVHDGSLSGTDGRHGDRQALCLQPPRGGPDARQAELALPAGDLRDPGVRHAGEEALEERQRLGKHERWLSLAEGLLSVQHTLRV